MRSLLVIIPLFLGVAGCGGGGDDGSEVTAGTPPAGETAPSTATDFNGRWSGQLFRGEDPCGVFSDETLDGGVYIQQTGSDATVYLGGLCSAALVGQASGNRLSTRQVAGTLNCADGQEAAIIQTFDLSEVGGSPPYGIATLGVESGCPERFCRGEMVGTLTQESAETLSCIPDAGDTPSGGATAGPSVAPTTTPSATPTTKPTPAPTPANRCIQCDVRGCCSRHGGVASCPGGAVVCADGTRSPSCTC